MTNLSYDNLRQAIADSGGLVAQADLARRYGTSRSAVHQWVHRTTSFPKAVNVVGSRTEVWFAHEVDDWVRHNANPRFAPPTGQEGGEEVK